MDLTGDEAVQPSSGSGGGGRRATRRQAAGAGAGAAAEGGQRRPGGRAKRGPGPLAEQHQQQRSRKKAVPSRIQAHQPAPAGEDPAPAPVAEAAAPAFLFNTFLHKNAADAQQPQQPPEPHHAPEGVSMPGRRCKQGSLDGAAVHTYRHAEQPSGAAPMLSGLGQPALFDPSCAAQPRHGQQPAAAAAAGAAQQPRGHSPGPFSWATKQEPAAGGRAATGQPAAPAGPSLPATLRQDLQEHLGGSVQHAQQAQHAQRSGVEGPAGASFGRDRPLLPPSPPSSGLVGCPAAEGGGSALQASLVETWLRKRAHVCSSVLQPANDAC